MSGHAHFQEPFPRGPLYGAAALVLLTLLGVGATRWAHWGEPAALPPGEVLALRELRFEDAPGGKVAVIDAASGQAIEYLDYGTNGFLRATLRGLARGRAPLGKGAEAPFRIEQRADGRLLLIDPVNNRVVDLWAFGPTNAAAFERYLDGAPAVAHSGQETTL